MGGGMVISQPPNYFGFIYDGSISNKSKEEMTMECYGEGIPVKDASPLSESNEESWWEKRHERMEKLMEEREKEALKIVRSQKAAVQGNYLTSLMAGE
jgi:hypothetical protein